MEMEQHSMTEVGLQSSGRLLVSLEPSPLIQTVESGQGLAKVASYPGHVVGGNFYMACVEL